jgi:SAM-dependent methyltransferase
VLGVGCGAGDELQLWAQEFGAAQVLGLEPDPALAAAATRFAGPDVEVRTLPWRALASHAGPAGCFDAVVCVDAAYHFSPRAAFLAAAWRAPAPGRAAGAFTDLVRDAVAPGAGGWGDRPAEGLVGGLRGAWVGTCGRLVKGLAGRLAGGIAHAGRGLALRAASRLAGVHPRRPAGDARPPPRAWRAPASRQVQRRAPGRGGAGRVCRPSRGGRAGR